MRLLYPCFLQQKWPCGLVGLPDLLSQRGIDRSLALTPSSPSAVVRTPPRGKVTLSARATSTGPGARTVFVCFFCECRGIRVGEKEGPKQNTIEVKCVSKTTSVSTWGGGSQKSHKGLSWLATNSHLFWSSFHYFAKTTCPPCLLAIWLFVFLDGGGEGLFICR